MLVAYLDDSGKDPQNRDTCLGGYIAPEEAWIRFEEEAEPIFREYIGDAPLHASDLHGSKGMYAGWKVVRKQAFIAKLCLKLNPIAFGVSFSARKEAYYRRAATDRPLNPQKRQISPYTFCMLGILNRVLTDVRIGKSANESGLALVIEAGHENNNEAKEAFDMIKYVEGVDQLRSLSFVSKTECRAIQMADLFAFYTRKNNQKIDHIGQKNELDPVLKVMVENLPHWTFVATDFGRAAGSRFLAGDP